MTETTAYLGTSAWIVARASPDDNLEYVYPGFGFMVWGAEVPEATRRGRVILPADGSTYDPEEYPDLAAALVSVGFEPGQLPDWRGWATVGDTHA